MYAVAPAFWYTFASGLLSTGACGDNIVADDVPSGADAGSLTFIVRVADDADDDTKGIFRRASEGTGQRDIPVRVLRENLHKTAALLREAFHDVAGQLHPLHLDEVQIGLEVSASGGVALIGTGEVKAGITLVFRAAEEPAK
jgi:hypothetical protein